MDTAILEKIGLSKNEIKVYFALLALGSTTTTPLVREAHIPPSKVYPALDRLIEKGLVSYVTKEKKKQYSATHPRNIIEYLNVKEKEIETQKDEIEKLIPQFTAQQTAQHEAHIYEGKEGIRTIFTTLFETLKRGDTYYVFYSGEKSFYDEWKTFFRNIHLKREKRGINVHILQKESLRSIAEEVSKDMKKYYVRYYKELMPTSWTLIYKDTVVHTTVEGKPIAFLIKSEQHATQYKKFFEKMWKKSIK